MNARSANPEIRSQLNESPETASVPEDSQEQAVFWKALYERERERLAKLWVAYQDAEAELAALKGKGKVASIAPVVVPTTVIDETEKGPFTYNGYTLHTRAVTLKNGGTRPIYFFSKKKPRTGRPSSLPDGYEVGVNRRTGLPFLQHTGHVTPEPEKTYHPQCAAVTADGKQCRNSARDTSKYCVSHKGYQPKTAEALAEAITDTSPRKEAQDTRASIRGQAQVAEVRTTYVDEDSTEVITQCQALTANSKQCRNDARLASKYCTAHKGYHPKSAETVVLDEADTRPRVSGALNTKPAIRKAAA